MPLNHGAICLAGLANGRQQPAVEQSWKQFHRLERADTPKNFSSVIPRHSRGRDLASFFVDEEIGRAAHIGASVGQIDSPLRVLVKAREESVADRDDLMGL